MRHDIQSIQDGNVSHHFVVIFNVTVQSASIRGTSLSLKGWYLSGWFDSCLFYKINSFFEINNHFGSCRPSAVLRNSLRLVRLFSQALGVAGCLLRLLYVWRIKTGTADYLQSSSPIIWPSVHMTSTKLFYTCRTIMLQLLHLYYWFVVKQTINISAASIGGL